MHPPGEVEADHEHDEQDRDGEQCPSDEPVPEDVVDRVALLRQVREEQVEDALTQVGDDDTEDGQERDAPLEQGRCRMQAVPAAVGEGGAVPWGAGPGSAGPG
ncbi:hypothetical protein GCM10022239_00680 [Leifsonia bigeumensis]|uniref:Uncharacterized protein n=1 Tax=Leifsonella bigeumensis TaxID=433643 RepID=A0ABP7EYZ2_9MICO